MADNTVQFRWIQTIQGNLAILYRSASDVFVAADHLIYPVEGDPTVRQAPDVYVAFGRPKRDRGSYKVWEEGGVFPQVVFEITSPGNRPAEMARKMLFYEQFGADEYYIYDPDRNTFSAQYRDGDSFERVRSLQTYTSRLLGISFDMSGPELLFRRPNGQRFLTVEELGERAERTDAAEQRAAAAAHRADRLAAMLRAAGIDPDAPG